MSTFDATEGYTKAAALFEKYGFWKTDMHYMNFIDVASKEDINEFCKLYPEVNVNPPKVTTNQIDANRARLGLPPLKRTINQ